MRELHCTTLKVAAEFHDQALRHSDVPKLGEFVVFDGKERKVKQLEARATQPGLFTVQVHLESMRVLTDEPTIEPHQQRVIDEYKELTERRDKLAAFTLTPLFRSLEEAERQRLDEQLAHMNGYQRVLAARIHAMGLSHKILTVT